MKIKRILAALMVLALAAGLVTALAAQGSQTDPLVTLSYLQQVFAPKVESQVDEAVAANQEELEKQLDLAVTSYETRVDETLAQAGAVFARVTLGSGERFTRNAGRELLLISGRATALGDLTDATAGTVIPDGEPLEAGHLYITTADENGLRAVSDVELMAR